METKLYEWACKKYGQANVDTRLAEIIDAINVENAKTLRINMVTTSTAKRLGKLAEAGLNIEYISIGSILIESSLMRIIQTYDFVVNGSLALAEIEHPLNIKSYPQNDFNALGSLIRELKRFSHNDKLFTLLGTFKSYREKAGHKAFETETDIEVVNEKVRGYVSKDPIKDIVREMVQEQISLQQGFVDRLKDFGCVGMGEPDFISAEIKLKEMENNKMRSAGVEPTKEPENL
jgi:hypothetical protein